MWKWFLIGGVCSLPFLTKAQDTIVIIDTNFQEELDTAHFWLEEITLTALPDLSEYDDRRQYYILKRKVLKVYPYVKVGIDSLQILREQMAVETRKRKQKKLAKRMEKVLREQFEGEVRQFTRSEGQIMMKLIHRGTGVTAYDLAKDMRGGVTAFLFQRIAKFYDSDMKSEFHPESVQEDMYIENILQRAFESGILEP
jgi:hypothetical protein